MKSTRKLLALATTTLIATSANAVNHGDDVKEADYRDYVVQIEVPKGNGSYNSCGGLLVGGDYIITAAHCVGKVMHSSGHSYTHPDFLGKPASWYNKYIDQGATARLNVYQGVSYHASSARHESGYRVIDIVNWSEYQRIATTEQDMVRRLDSSINWATQTPPDYYDLRNEGADIALLKIDTPIPQTSHAAVEPLFNEKKSTTASTLGDAYVNRIGDKFMFRGWGLTETGDFPTTMQETELQAIYSSEGSSLGKSLDGTGFSASALCPTSSLYACELRMRDTVRTKATKINSDTNKGDSGTPLVSNGDRVIGFTRSGAGGESSFTTTSYYMPQILTQINRVVAPASMPFTFKDGSNTTVVKKFRVQNLSHGDDSVNVKIIGHNNFAVSGCVNADLKATESCEITLTIKPNGSAWTAGATQAVIMLNDSKKTQIPVSATVEKKTTGGTTPSKPVASGSSGGSMGQFSLFGMFILVIARRVKSMSAMK